MIAILLFLGCIIVVFYIMAGYPLLLAVLAQRYPRPVRRERLRKSVTVIVPAYNGELYIADKLRSVLSLDYPRELLEILVVSDGSTDSTEAIVQGFAPQGVQLI